MLYGGGRHIPEMSHMVILIIGGIRVQFYYDGDAISTLFGNVVPRACSVLSQLCATGAQRGSRKSPRNTSHLYECKFGQLACRRGRASERPRANICKQAFRKRKPATLLCKAL